MSWIFGTCLLLLVHTHFPPLQIQNSGGSVLKEIRHVGLKALKSASHTHGCLAESGSKNSLFTKAFHLWHVHYWHVFYIFTIYYMEDLTRVVILYEIY